MFSVAFCGYGKTNLEHAMEHLNAVEYIKLMERKLLPWTTDNVPVSWIYQQDKSSAHSARVTQKWFREQGVRVMK